MRVWDALQASPYRVQLVVDPDERMAYQAAYPTAEALCCDAPRGIAPKRQWILDHTTTPFVLMLDDDLTFRVRQPDLRLVAARPADVANCLQILATWLAEGVVQVGVSQQAGNNRVTAAYAEGHRCINAYGFNRAAVAAAGARFDRAGAWFTMEDFDMTLQLLRAGHLNRVTYQYAVTQPPNRAGGCATYRTGDSHARSAETLAHLHPGLVTVRRGVTTNWPGFPPTRTDVEIAWLKAYRQRNQEVML